MEIMNGVAWTQKQVDCQMSMSIYSIVETSQVGGQVLLAWWDMVTVMLVSPSSATLWRGTPSLTTPLQWVLTPWCG